MSPAGMAVGIASRVVRASGIHVRSIPQPLKVPKTMAQSPKIESIGSIGSMILDILEVQVVHEHCLTVSLVPTGPGYPLASKVRPLWLNSCN